MGLWVDSKSWFIKNKKGSSGTKARITAKKFEATFPLCLAGVLHRLCDNTAQRGYEPNETFCNTAVIITVGLVI